MKILLATGIYPPQIGGPAQYAFNLEREFSALGHKVSITKFSDVCRWPSGIRHLIYFLKLFPFMWRVDWCLALDTFSVALPAVLAAKICGTKIIIRAGGDFLWENYVERTGDLVLFRDFYKTRRLRWSFKEKLIFRLVCWALQHCDLLVFSTKWQRNIFLSAYNLETEKLAIVENYYGPTETKEVPSKKIFVSGTRKLKWKNKDKLLQALGIAQQVDPGLILDDKNYSYDEFVSKIKQAYAVILVSLGDISPNMILDAIRCGTPFILTRENGLSDRLGDVALLCDPTDENDIAEKILTLSKPDVYRNQLEKLNNFSFIHLWSTIADEFLNLVKKL